MRELLAEVQLALYDMANNSGDVPEWNEGGSLYDLSKRIKAALIKHPPAIAAATAEIDRARRLYGTEAIQIDDDAKASRYDTGVWVQAWLDVEDEE